MSTLNPIPTKPAPQSDSIIPDAVKTILIFALLLAVVYLLISGHLDQKANLEKMSRMSDELKALEKISKVSEATLNSQIVSLKTDLDGAQQAVGHTKAEMQREAQRIQEEGRKVKTELSAAIATKADTSLVDAQVQAVKTDAENKFGQVNTEVGGVKTQVNTVKTDLENTRRDLEGTQRQLLDVRDTLSAAVAKNSSELSQLRLKGERDYVEFTLQKKNDITKVEDIRLVLSKTDEKKGKFDLRIMVDDSKLEKKDRAINEPIQFLVGHNRVRYEVVTNWVQKNKAGGYLSIPKDKALSAERSK
jgi:hypothetical protein